MAILVVFLLKNMTPVVKLTKITGGCILFITNRKIVYLVIYLRSSVMLASARPTLQTWAGQVQKGPQNS